MLALQLALKSYSNQTCCWIVSWNFLFQPFIILTLVICSSRHFVSFLQKQQGKRQQEGSSVTCRCVLQCSDWMKQQTHRPVPFDDGLRITVTSKTSHGCNFEIIIAGLTSALSLPLACGMWKKDSCNWDIILVFQFKHEKLDFSLVVQWSAAGLCV